MHFYAVALKETAVISVTKRHHAPGSGSRTGISSFGGKAFTVGLAMAPANTATVFVVDDDASILASIQGLLKSAGLRSEGFETAEKFLQRKPLANRFRSMKISPMGFLRSWGTEWDCNRC